MRAFPSAWATSSGWSTMSFLSLGLVRKPVSAIIPGVMGWILWS